MMQTKHLLVILTVGCLLASCGHNGKSLAEGAAGDIDGYESTDVNAVEQARPTIMVIPSDHLLRRYGAFELADFNGQSVPVRDYARYLAANQDNKAVISAVQNAFVEANYPIQSLEQTLKQLSTKAATDEASGIYKDARTELLSVAQPDIIIELDYRSGLDPRQPLDKALNASFTIEALDAYTNDVLSAVSKDGLKGSSIGEAVTAGLKSETGKLLGDIRKSFSDILTRGRNVTVRIAIAEGAGLSLNNMATADMTYADWIIDYIKTHTVKGAYKMQNNTASEMSFTNCRIKLLNEDGTQFGVYDWAREMTGAMRTKLNVDCTNRSQGLGEILIIIEGGTRQ